VTGTGDPLPWSVGAAYGLAGLLLLLGLCTIARRRSWGSGIACLLAGLVLAVGTVIYTQSAATLGQQLMAAGVGGAGGLLLWRRIPLSAIPVWLAAFQGFAGLTAMAAAIGLYRDPSALGLADPVAQEVWGSARIGIALALAFGAMNAAGAVVAVTDCGSRAVPPVLRIALPVAILCAAIAFQISPETPILYGVAGLSIPAGILITLCEERMVRLCFLAIASGGAAASLGLVLHNPAMLIGGSAVVGTAAALARLLRRSAATHPSSQQDDATPLSNKGALL